MTAPFFSNYGLWIVNCSTSIAIVGDRLSSVFGATDSLLRGGSDRLCSLLVVPAPMRTVIDALQALRGIAAEVLQPPATPELVRGTRVA